MRIVVSIGLLLLLLYHAIVVPVMLLGFENDFEKATPIHETDEWVVVRVPISLPYTMAWENTDGQEGLVQEGDKFYNITHQHYANDTLYTVLKTNQNARERFYELAEQINDLIDSSSIPSSNPLDSLMKLLKKGLSTYVLPQSVCITLQIVSSLLPTNFQEKQVLLLPTVFLSGVTPPPEQ